MEFVVDKPFLAVVSSMNQSASSVPLNIYFWLSLHFFGWSEFILRLPSLAGGILSLGIIPVVVRRFAGRRPAITFAFLLAISPFLIFYSRVCRPYSIYMLVGFLAIIAGCYWGKYGGRKYLILYIAASVFAVYLHLFAIVAVIASLGFLFFAKLVSERLGFPIVSRRIAPTFRTMALALTAIAVLLGVILMPSLLHYPFRSELTGDRANLESLTRGAAMISGTWNQIIACVFWGLFGVGQYMFFTKNRLLAGIFLSHVILFVISMLTLCHHGINTPLAYLHFFIPLFPLNFVFVALGADAMANWLSFTRQNDGRGNRTLLGNFMIASFVAALAITGPLRQVICRSE